MQATLNFDVVECAECGIPFGVTTDRVERLRKSHALFYCPKGHSQSFPQKTDEERLREQVNKKGTEILQLKEQLEAKKSRKKKVS